MGEIIKMLPESLIVLYNKRASTTYNLGKNCIKNVTAKAFSLVCITIWLLLSSWSRED